MTQLTIPFVESRADRMARILSGDVGDNRAQGKTFTEAEARRIAASVPGVAVASTLAPIEATT